jgi:hypothetical protein
MALCISYFLHFSFQNHFLNKALFAVLGYALIAQNNTVIAKKRTVIDYRLFSIFWFVALARDYVVKFNPALFENLVAT